MNRTRCLPAVVIPALLWLALIFGTSGAWAQQDATVQQLAADVARVQMEVRALEAENEIENLQRIFGFYFDKNLWTQVADLFTEDGSIEIGGSGVYRGKARILAYLQTLGGEGPQQGILNDHMQLQPVIHLGADGESANGRWQHFSQEAVWGESHHWGSGVYENAYRYEDGVWKISRLQLYTTLRTPYDAGWAVTAMPRSSPSQTLPPDEPPSSDYQNYPAVFVPPFHYQNPVTARPPPQEVPRAQLDALQSLESISVALRTLDRQLTRLQDADDLERLHTIYGYYLARNQWDDLAGIFAEDGTIEIALRGIYRGREGVRRNLDLYGVQDELPGTLHNHMQFQPVIHVAEDGQSAQMRSRAFSMMGNYGGVGRWMGGTYENTFVKRDGVWQILKDQVINTWFATYDEGWKDLQLRPAPGISETNPPDAPPSLYFEMYPSPYLPAFHYPNPVTGRQTVWE